MTVEMRSELTPQQYIRQLFSETKDGKLDITYHYPLDIEDPYTINYTMDWTEKDAETIVQLYDALATMLRKFGQLHTELKNEEKRNCLLTAEEVTCWETYIRPFSPFKVEETVIGELYLRGEYDSLDDEENELLERHFWWRERNSLERMPFLRRSPRVLILRAQRYEKLVSLHAPEVVIQEEGRWLAEEMVLYYFGPQEVQVFEE
jgi:hypothetical protein